MKTLHVAIIIALSAPVLFAQPREGRTRELSLSGSFQSYSTETSSYYESGSGTASAFLVSPRLGFFVFEGLELEPEILFLFSSGDDPVYVLNGNVSYNFLSEGNGVPFLLIGYGLANTVPFFNVPLTRSDFTIGVLNAGGGVKVFLKEDIAFRIEYRYQLFSGKGKTTYYDFSSTRVVNTRIHSVQFGLSILL